MVETETESHNSKSPRVQGIFERLSVIPSHSIDFSPEEEITTNLVLYDTILHVEREWLFNIVFFIILILVLICLFISSLVVIWGDGWLHNANITHYCETC